jgi:hypothetical protein
LRQQYLTQGSKSFTEDVPSKTFQKQAPGKEMSVDAQPFKPRNRLNEGVEILEESTSESEHDHDLMKKSARSNQKKQVIDYNQMATLKRPKR